MLRTTFENQKNPNTLDEFIQLKNSGKGPKIVKNLIDNCVIFWMVQRRIYRFSEVFLLFFDLKNPYLQF